MNIMGQLLQVRWIAKIATLLGVALGLIGTVPAHADTWIGDSLELSVADADLVVWATLESSEPFTNVLDHKGTLRVKATLKGDAGRSVECLIPYDDERYLAQWEKDRTELLVCLVKSERYGVAGNKDPMATPWTVRHGLGGETGIIPLDGNSMRRAATMNFVLLTKADDILKLAADAIRADADTKVARQSDGSVPSLLVDVPFDTPLDKELHSMSANGLAVPINETTEAKARDWIGSADAESRQNGVLVLAHFKSDENIAALKTMLTDPDVQIRIDGTNAIKRYPVRATALAALRAWGIDATAVISETSPVTGR
jgi:hypothetical protein